MNKLISSLLAITAASIIAVPVYAKGVDSPPKRPFWTQLAQAKTTIKTNHPRAAIGAGTLTAINGTTLTVDKNGTAYTVKTGTFDRCTTKFVRRFGAPSGISEMTVGHTLNVTGVWEDVTAKTTVDACVIRDTSIQKRHGVFVGNVVSLTSTGWVMTTVRAKRANQTVTVSSTTTMTNRANQAIAQSDIQVGHRVSVRGMWDSVNNTATEVTNVKDFSLPIQTK